ncbi:sugar transferase [Rhodoplanes sp. TEM]|uniref:Sugar transferase n=1 Tax=Rhodoplanes tepidamans TaxID=200616 RepID=A0ABT5J6I5_RHOTP|nr:MULTISPECIES: sugar transferase [Rhodoplanes]MDC7785245.1 sugar transferase [Rhodoplanes tepidamans]MDC7986403.1 sugar transferase [Rhodoplanes sp. TEM]
MNRSETPTRYLETSCQLGGISKRSLDIAISIGGLLFLAPLFLLTAILVKWADGGPVFFAHQRLGYGGRPFRCWKFRTMVPNGDEVLRAHLSKCPEAAREWSETRKIKNDPRVTAIGAVLRQLSIDELPQLINVLRGEMSIVGPRPIVGSEVSMYGQTAGLYFQTRPGLTGAWQISGRNDVSYQQRVELDRHYIENWSFTLDLLIIVKTIPVVLLAKGSY